MSNREYVQIEPTGSGAGVAAAAAALRTRERTTMHILTILKDVCYAHSQLLGYREKQSCQFTA